MARILLIDDEALRLGLCRALKRVGYEIEIQAMLESR